jgi:hypothetical protein
MISITELFQKVVLVEENKKEGILHLPHLVEKAIIGKPNEVLLHLHDLSNWIQNKPTQGSLTIKVDGKVSTKGGKDDTGRPFAMYKGSGKQNVPLYSHKEIEEWSTKNGKPHLKDSLSLTLDAASHPNLESGTLFQADTLLKHSPTTFKGNIIEYENPKSRLSHLKDNRKGALAIHTFIKDGQTIPAPNLSHLSTDKILIPSLSMDHIQRQGTLEEINKLNHHMSEIQKIFDDPEVARVTKAIARHRDTTNKNGHRYIFLKEFNNAFQRGEYGDKRSVDSLMIHATKKLTNATQTQKDRILGHIKYFTTRKGTSSNILAIHSMLQGHDHIDAARDIITQIAHRTKPDLKPIDPKTGKVNYNMGEGLVHVLPGLDPIKLVPREFTMRNTAESEAIKKKPILENEGMVMTASGGGISGMGYNLGGPAPDDVAVAPLAQRKRKVKQGIIRKLLGRMNVGRTRKV